MINTPTTGRARDMYSMYAHGATLKYIGEQYHITRERVRQVINSYRRSANLPEPPRSPRARRQRDQLLKEALA